MIRAEAFVLVEWTAGGAFVTGASPPPVGRWPRSERRCCSSRSDRESRRRCRAAFARNRGESSTSVDVPRELVDVAERMQQSELILRHERLHDAYGRADAAAVRWRQPRRRRCRTVRIGTGRAPHPRAGSTGRFRGDRLLRQGARRSPLRPSPAIRAANRSRSRSWTLANHDEPQRPAGCDAAAPRPRGSRMRLWATSPCRRTTAPVHRSESRGAARRSSTS